MSRKRHSLRTRVVLIIIGSVVVTSLLFGLIALTIAYTTEDRVFRRALKEEVAYQTAAWDRTGALVAPANPDIVIYRSGQPLPPAIVKGLQDAPARTEFYGNAGRHYHIARFELPPSRAGQAPVPAMAVIEVSRDLLIRPYRDSIIGLMVGLSLFLAIIMALIGWWLVHRALKPLTRLARDLGNPASTIPVIAAEHYPANEIGTLAEALRQAFTRIAGFVERERAFTRDASHELRTPLAVVRGAAEVMALHRDLPPALLDPLRRIDSAATDMTLALDQLLALARETNGVPKEQVTLRPLVDKAVLWSKVRYPDAGVAVSNTLGDDAIVHANPTAVQLVLNNLLGNCFQHAGPGTLIVEFDQGCLAIADDGPGIETAGDPFAPFAKGTSSMGSGLGLDITRRLCEAAGIGLSAGPGAGGRGTRFCLQLAGD